MASGPTIGNFVVRINNSLGGSPAVGYLVIRVVADFASAPFGGSPAVGYLVVRIIADVGDISLGGGPRVSNLIIGIIIYGVHRWSA
ncbi:MAG: hypothetical protein M1821_002556 [Bathelium mastoideum]|nr:MAG: hypothetical protein M1821_002556 [Bathelium mastoideum]